MNIREINQTIEEGISLKLVAAAYGEIASIKIKKIRFEVEKNRSFLKEISAVYKIVKQHAALKGLLNPKTKKILSILMTSNYHFYGGIDNKVIHHFINNTAKISTDRVVIGKTGQDYLKTMKYFNTFASVEHKADLPTPQELGNLVLLVKDYQKVLVFYPELVTILNQNPKIADITQSSQDSSSSENQKDYVIFEPELNKIAQFFDSQVSILLLEQLFFEAELARTASRLISMDQAQVEANNFIKRQKQIKSHLIASIENIKLLENLASLRASRLVIHE